MSNTDHTFMQSLFEKLRNLNPAVSELTLDELGYCLETLTPNEGWDALSLPTQQEIEALITSQAFYESIQLKPKLDGKLVLDSQVKRLNQQLLAGLVKGAYPLDWVNQHFYFDLRGFLFFHRTQYFDEQVLTHLGSSPYRRFAPLQQRFESQMAVTYRQFKQANAEIDQCFMDTLQKLVTLKGTPILIAIAGQTAAGKTEIVERLQAGFEANGQSVTTIEIDHFLTDRDYREAHGIDSLGQQALHYELFKACLADICLGKKITTPRYDFVAATSSHALNGKLKEDCQPLEVEPADIIFIEGNFPFLLEEIAHLIGIKVAYLTDDPVRMKRKWWRDMDLRKKYDLAYFLNRYFREQFLMAESAYRPQLALCDLLVDTTQAMLWATPEIQRLLES